MSTTDAREVTRNIEFWRNVASSFSTGQILQHLSINVDCMSWNRGGTLHLSAQNVPLLDCMAQAGLVAMQAEAARIAAAYQRQLHSLVTSAATSNPETP